MLLLDLIDNYFRSRRNSYLLPVHQQSEQVLHQDLLVDTIVQC